MIFMNTLFPHVIISVKPNKGYTFDASQEIDNSTREAIRNNWLPPGKELGKFIGINIIRIIPLPNGKKGWVEIKVTSDKDEFNREGLLWSRVTIVPDGYIDQVAQTYISNLPAAIRNVSKLYLPNKLWLSWRTFWGLPTIYTYSKAFPQDWQIVEATIIRSFLELPLLLRRSITISTLSLSNKKTDIKKAGILIGIPSETLSSRKAHVTVR